MIFIRDDTLSHNLLTSWHTRNQEQAETARFKSLMICFLSIIVKSCQEQLRHHVNEPVCTSFAGRKSKVKLKLKCRVPPGRTPSRSLSFTNFDRENKTDHWTNGRNERHHRPIASLSSPWTATEESCRSKPQRRHALASRCILP
jgi:hypothetical protein